MVDHLPSVTEPMELLEWIAEDRPVLQVTKESTRTGCMCQTSPQLKLHQRLTRVKVQFQDNQLPNHLLKKTLRKKSHPILRKPPLRLLLSHP